MYTPNGNGEFEVTCSTITLELPSLLLGVQTMTKPCMLMLHTMLVALSLTMKCVSIISDICFTMIQLRLN